MKDTPIQQAVEVGAGTAVAAGIGSIIIDVEHAMIAFSAFSAGVWYVIRIYFAIKNRGKSSEDQD